MTSIHLQSILLFHIDKLLWILTPCEDFISYLYADIAKAWLYLDGYD